MKFPLCEYRSLGRQVACQVTGFIPKASHSIMGIFSLSFVFPFLSLHYQLANSSSSTEKSRTCRQAFWNVSMKSNAFNLPNRSPLLLVLRILVQLDWSAIFRNKWRPYEERICSYTREASPDTPDPQVTSAMVTWRKRYVMWVFMKFYITTG